MASGGRSGFDAFCGDSIFNESLLLESKWPRFTSCFQNSVLVWVPCGWLWVTLIPYLYYLFKYQKDPIAIPANKLNMSKTFMSFILTLLAAIEALQAESVGISGDDKVYDVTYLAGGLKAGSYLLSAALIQAERARGIITSGILWLFWFGSVIAGIIPFYSKIYLQEYDKGHLTFTLFYVSYTCLVIQLFLASWAESMQQGGYYPMGEVPSPEQEASFPSRLSFHWINSLVVQAYRRPLQEDDVFALHPRDKCSISVPQFGKPWAREVARAKLKRRYKSQMDTFTNGVASFSSPKVKATKGVSNVQSNERTRLIGGEPEDTPTTSSGANIELKNAKKELPKLQASLFKVLAKTYGFELLQAHLCKFIYDLLQFVSPILLNTLIDYTHNLDENRAKGLQWKGYVLACSFFVVSTFGSVMFQQNFHIGLTLGMRIKAALISAVYKKSLTISNESKKASTVGEVVNLMSVDCQRLQDIAGYLWMLWSAPLQITLAMYMLWNVVGVATLAGLAIMILLMPLNAVIATLGRKYQIRQMKLKDERIKLMSEVLGGMKVLKLYAWEPSFKDKINVIRAKELDVLRKSAYLSAISSFTWTCAPFMVTLGTFATYVLVSENHYLDANKAFVALSLFNILRFPINLLPQLVTFLVQASVSVGRVGKYLRHEDLDHQSVNYDSHSRSAISIKGGQFTWDTSNPTSTLANINIDIPVGGLVAVVGQVGAGKSSLVSAILGEMEKLQGEVTVKSSMAYVPQQAWIQNATLKDNILFGKQVDEREYAKVIDDCALKSDLEILPGGDNTEIGEKGINLSGGQKQRVSLARAVYSNADIFLLDDPLSAVDSHVGKHIFERVISHKGSLRGKTRVLVTHGIHWLPQVDTIIVLTEGRVSECGSYEELLSHDGDFAQFLKAHLTRAAETEDDEDDDPEIVAIKAKILERVDSVTSDGGTSADEISLSSKSGRQLSRTLSKRTTSMSRQQSVTSKKDEAVVDKKPKAGERLTEEEKSETGKIELVVFMSYFKAIGVIATALFFGLYAAYQGTNIYSSIWLSDWTSDSLLQNTSLTNTSRYEDRNYMYLGVYGALGVVQAILVLFYALIASTRMVKAAGVLHADMLTNILHNPMAFFDTTPSGRILNRFSKDVDTVDNRLPQLFRSWMSTFFGCVGTIVVISYSAPIFMTVILPLGILYYVIQRFYIPTSRQLKRLESTTRSPIYSHFSETIAGATSIRAYKASERFKGDSQAMIDKNLIYYFAGIASNRWLAIRLEFLGNILILAAAMFVVVSENSNESLVGLSISYALSVTGSLNWMVRASSDLETNIVSVERMKEYSQTETEAAWINPFKRPPASWPQDGRVQFVNYQTRYRPGLDLVLKGISCDIQGGEKIGIVGRTGAGKSSMTVALFRLIEAAAGNILIDGITVSDIGLHDLRSRITILPQDPVLFSGSLRMNIDPTHDYGDDEIWRVLEHAHLKQFTQDAVGGLHYECGEDGQNLSVGQRQLVCLARSLLRKTKILVLDEATAAVDMETDLLIQNTIRTEFKECTVLTIAHRLNTIMDYDRIMVLDQGEIKEMDSPSALLEDRSSLFYGMANDANLV